MEESGINDKLKTTADRIANKGAEFSNTLFKKTRDSISSINQITKASTLRENAKDKISSISGRIWGVSLNILHFSLICNNNEIIIYVDVWF